MGELLKLLGFATPLIYATAAYGLFHWLDENASDEAKAALARTMSLYKTEKVAPALVEIFDQIYTYPLLSWRAFSRSFLFTTAISLIFMFEFRESPIFPIDSFPLDFVLRMLAFNVCTDYLALFVVRRVLLRSGTRPVVGLAFGAVSGAAIVIAAHFLRSLWVTTFGSGYVNLVIALIVFAGWSLPALVVFVWLPLLALGIVVARLTPPAAWVVGKAQWFLKDGKEHPLKAIGYVAAVVVFLGTAVGRAVFEP
ncbi:hypothetical protein [Bradyrhizobium liaoningense]